jgi:hypothetical protein
VSARIDRSWLVFDSVENDQHDRCVDLFRRPDGSFGFELFRRDVEDEGRWTPVAYHAGVAYGSCDEATKATTAAVVWLAEALGRRPGR